MDKLLFQYILGTAAAIGFAFVGSFIWCKIGDWFNNHRRKSQETLRHLQETKPWLNKVNQ